MQVASKHLEKIAKICNVKENQVLTGILQKVKLNQRIPTLFPSQYLELFRYLKKHKELKKEVGLKNLPKVFKNEDQ